MSKEWAILHHGEIVTVVTGSRIGAERAGARLGLSDYQVADLYSLPPQVQQNYRYWNERP